VLCIFLATVSLVNSAGIERFMRDKKPHGLVIEGQFRYSSRGFFYRSIGVRAPIIAGNWKMQGSLASNASRLALLKAAMGGLDPVQLMVFPPAAYLAQAQALLLDTSIRLGAQNVSANENGAYTGEISTAMLQDFACQAVLVGHSERRCLFAEDDVQVALKFAQVKRYQMTPILCLGETHQQRRAGETERVLFAQLDTVIQMSQGVAGLRDCVLAYEPVWAIGSGLTATPEQAQGVHAAIRAKIASLDSEIAETLPILYGGSVTAANAKALFAMPDIDGGLIGGASLRADEFIEIAKCMKSFF
jgi:triosephosphate isomerase (TIM)